MRRAAVALLMELVVQISVGGVVFYFAKDALSVYFSGGITLLFSFLAGYSAVSATNEFFNFWRTLRS